MKIRELLIIIVFFPLIYVLIYFTLPRHGTVVYNCSIAEISPDIPVEAKEQCRKLRIEQAK